MGCKNCCPQLIQFIILGQDECIYPSVLAAQNLISKNIENREKYIYHSKKNEFKYSIELENISFNYENKNILDNVSLKIKKGINFIRV